MKRKFRLWLALGSMLTALLSFQAHSGLIEWDKPGRYGPVCSLPPAEWAARFGRNYPKLEGPQGSISWPKAEKLGAVQAVPFFNIWCGPLRPTPDGNYEKKAYFSGDVQAGAEPAKISGASTLTFDTNGNLVKEASQDGKNRLFPEIELPELKLTGDFEGPDGEKQKVEVMIPKEKLEELRKVEREGPQKPEPSPLDRQALSREIEDYFRGLGPNSLVSDDFRALGIDITPLQLRELLWRDENFSIRRDLKSLDALEVYPDGRIRVRGRIIFVLSARSSNEEARGELEIDCFFRLEQGRLALLGLNTSAVAPFAFTGQTILASIDGGPFALVTPGHDGRFRSVEPGQEEGVCPIFFCVAHNPGPPPSCSRFILPPACDLLISCPFAGPPLICPSCLQKDCGLGDIDLGCAAPPPPQPPPDCCSTPGVPAPPPPAKCP